MNRSEELCKLLGLKTEIRWRGALGLHLWEHKIIDDNGNETEKVEIYPDLTKSSNFVKLLKLRMFKTNMNTVGSYYSNNFNHSHPEENFISELADGFRWMTDTSKKIIRQQAQQIEWEY